MKFLSLTALTENFEQWQPAELDSKKYISWPAGEVRWLAANITVPKDLQGYPLSGHSLRLSLVWWSIDTQIYINGQLAQAGDLFDARARVLLGASVQAGDTWDVRIRMVSPGHDRGSRPRGQFETQGSRPILLGAREQRPSWPAGPLSREHPQP